MWNCNSLVAWLLARSRHDLDHVQPPLAGRAPGWAAGLVVATRQGIPEVHELAPMPRATA